MRFPKEMSGYDTRDYDSIQYLDVALDKINLKWVHRISIYRIVFPPYLDINYFFFSNNILKISRSDVLLTHSVPSPTFGHL